MAGIVDFRQQGEGGEGLAKAIEGLNLSKQKIRADQMRKQLMSAVAEGGDAATVRQRIASMMTEQGEQGPGGLGGILDRFNPASASRTPSGYEGALGDMLMKQATTEKQPSLQEMIAGAMGGGGAMDAAAARRRKDQESAGIIIPPEAKAKISAEAFTAISGAKKKGAIKKLFGADVSESSMTDAFKDYLKTMNYGQVGQQEQRVIVDEFFKIIDKLNTGQKVTSPFSDDTDSDMDFTGKNEVDFSRESAGAKQTIKAYTPDGKQVNVEGTTEQINDALRNNQIFRTPPSGKRPLAKTATA